MPLVAESPYHPPLPFRNRHVHTVYPALFRKVNDVHYQRERITLPDADFLDLDWSKLDNTQEGIVNHNPGQLAIFLHGLEGSTDRSYIRGMVRAFNQSGWDAVAVNFRGCSGETNRLLRSYHAGATEDLQAVVEHVLNTSNYSRLVLVGFSLGGNLTLKYLGDLGANVPAQIQGAVGISVPCDLAASVEAMSEPSNSIYMKRFMRHLRAKMVAKAADYPDDIDLQPLYEMKTFYEFDNLYTAPLHGFENADVYWRTCSCLAGLKNISIPTLVLNAADDPFLAPACYPVEEAKANADLSRRHGNGIRSNHAGGRDWHFETNDPDTCILVDRIADFIVRGSFGTRVGSCKTI